MDKLIKELQEKGIMGIGHLKIKGKAKPVLEFISLMTYTKPMVNSPEQWSKLVETIRN